MCRYYQNFKQVKPSFSTASMTYRPVEDCIDLTVQMYQHSKWGMILNNKTPQLHIKNNVF